MTQRKNRILECSSNEDSADNAVILDLVAARGYTRAIDS